MPDAPDSPARDTPPDWHARDMDAVLSALDTSLDGLSAEEAERRVDQNGENRLPEQAGPGPLKRLARQFNNLLILVLVAAAVITGLLGHYIDTAVILAVVVANTAIGFFQEGRAERALAALRGMLAPKAVVWRDGERASIPAVRLAAGDIVWLEAGDRTPADLRLLEARGLRIDESMLTGESVPARKQTDPVAADASLGDRRSMAYSGTLISEGRAKGVVTATGGHTEIGRISGMIADVQTLTTPLICQMGVLARWLTGFLAVLAAGVFAFSLLVRDEPFSEAFMIVVGLFVAAIPEGLPAVLTVTLAIGVQTMARRSAIVRRLPAIETLGAVSVVCSDKTGTLTRNEMMVAGVATAAGRYEVDGEGYAPEGRITAQEAEADLSADPALERIGLIAALCASASIEKTGEGWRVQGDPMEGALLALAGKLGRKVSSRPAEIDMIPFDARHRYMAVLHEIDGKRMALIKGAPEAILERCGSQLAPEGENALDMSAWEAVSGEIAAEGRRVLALAYKRVEHDRLDHDDVREGLVLAGFTGLIDPPRPEAIDAVSDCRAAGIAVKMITGDHAGTAAAIGRQIGLERTAEPLTGADLDSMDDAALAEAVSRTDVFARTSPEHKLRLVTALQAQGAVVAMTGDGVNDAPALKRADAGIAMGLKGSEAAREAADLVLTDDNFASIAEAIRQGRTVYANLKKVITFLLPVNGGESLSLVIAVMFGLVLPITPLQILWVNMISSVALAMALAFEKPERTIMERPPRRARAPLLSPFLIWRVGLVSVLFSIGVFGQFALARQMGGDVETARTMALNTLVAMEIFYLFSVRYMHGPSVNWSGLRGTRPVLIAVALVIGLQAVFTYAPFMNMLFETRPLDPLQLALCSMSGIALLAVLEVEKALTGRWRGD
ncbi:HAD-IC family P-type ATPase [Glycocaulis profundi]|nr:HAD-IC family P-type ATPase [Glycocaulis profundi]